MIRKEYSRLVPLRLKREELLPMMIGSDVEYLDEFCARFGLPLEHLWSIRKQPTVRMVDSVSDDAMRRRFEDSEQLLVLLERWDADGVDAGPLPAEVDHELADREKRLALERLTVMIRRRNDRHRV
jgi:hypothetical protein